MTMTLKAKAVGIKFEILDFNVVLKAMEAGRRYTIVGQGTIRIQSESPYEHLDPITADWLDHLKQMWSLLKKSKATTQLITDFLSKSKNPHEAALQLMVTSGDFYSGKQTSLSQHVMETFSNYLETEKNMYNKIYSVPESLKKDAFNLVIKQKNNALVSLVVNNYNMVESKELFLDSIKNLITANLYKEACQCAVLLKLHKYFTIEDFLIPLVFQDKYAIAENFLEDSKKHQIELATFLDDLLGKRNIRNEAEVIARKLNIFDAKVNRLQYKPLSKLVARIVKTFNLPSTVCPNLTVKRGKGALQFLLHKRYVAKEIGEEGWAEMALEAVGDDENLRIDLVEGVALYGDLKEALNWAERFQTPVETWPFKLKEFHSRLKVESSDSIEEENWDEPQQSLKFHQLTLPESQIHLIDTALDFSNFLNEMSNGVSVIGFDSEWKPTFGLKKSDLSLIQVATFHQIYILDVISLGSSAPQHLWERFANVIFGNADILKLGFGLNEDLSLMRETLRKFHRIKTSDLGFLDLAVLWKILIQNHNFVFPFSSVTDSKSSKGLSSLIEMCLGEKLDKSDQFSNWENRPLRKSQIIYAALDAYCLLEAYRVIIREGEAQGIPITEVISELMSEVPGKGMEKKKRKNPRGKWKKEEKEIDSAKNVIIDTKL